GGRGRRGGGGRGSRGSGPGAAVAGSGEHHEVRGRRHADLVRRVLGRGGRRGILAGQRRRAARHRPGDRPGRPRVRGPAAPGGCVGWGGGAVSGAECRIAGGLRFCGGFWYAFVFGADWRGAAVVALAWVMPAVLVHVASVNAWWLLPAAVIAALGWSLRRATAAKP